MNTSTLVLAFLVPPDIRRPGVEFCSELSVKLALVLFAMIRMLSMVWRNMLQLLLIDRTVIMYRRGQVVIFPAGARVFPAGNLD